MLSLHYSAVVIPLMDYPLVPHVGILRFAIDDVDDLMMIHGDVVIISKCITIINVIINQK